MAEEICEVLFKSQKDVLVDYEPCLIPPKSLKNPVRVGQAKDYEAEIRILERMRGVPDGRWKKQGKDLIERLIRGSEKAHGSFPRDQRPKVVKTVTKIIERARSLEDFEFELQKNELAEQLGVLDLKHQLKEELKEATGATEEDIVLRQIRAFFLDPHWGPLAEQRIAQMKSSPKAGQTDLDKISPAPSCKRGGCALKEYEEKNKKRKK
jgi:hypothetical protein